MRGTSIGCLVLALTACGGSSPKPTPTDTAAVPVPPSKSEPTQPETVHGTVVDSMVEIADECKGTKLDLTALAAQRACGVVVRDPPAPLPPSIQVSLVQKAFTVKSGGKTQGEVVLTNTTQADVAVVLENACGELATVTYEMLNAKGTRVDYAEPDCGRSHDCLAMPMRIQLAPKGTAHVKFDIVAQVETETIKNGECQRHRIKPVPKGKYTLKLTSQLFAQLAVPITVK